MKKLLSLLTLLVVAISTSWAQTDPDLSLTSFIQVNGENATNAFSRYVKAYTDEGITLSSWGSSTTAQSSFGAYSDVSGVTGVADGRYYADNANGARSQDVSKYCFVVKATAETKKIVKVSYLLASNGDNKEVKPVLFGWEGTPSATLDYYEVYSTGVSMNRNFTDAQWFDFDLSEVDKELKEVRLYRATDKSKFTLNGESSTLGQLGSNNTFRVYGIKVWLADTSSPAISVENVNIAKDATSAGEIAFSVVNPVEGGAVTAAKKTEADWLTLGTVDNTNGKLPFSAEANTGAPRTATVTLTYTYNTTSTVTKDVTITQAAPTFAITYSPGADGEGTIEAGEKSYDVDFTLSSSTFSRDEYIQTGWATSDGGEKAYDLGGTYTANAAIELFPVWEAHATKGTTIISATITSKNAATVTGTIGGTADVNVQNTADSDGGHKFGSNGHYVGLTLANGTFKAGDVINVHVTQAAQQGTIAIYADNAGATLLQNTETVGEVGDNMFTLNSSVAEKSTIYICRPNDDNKWNAFVSYISVTRPNKTITLNASGYATYSYDKDFAFAGAKAYKMALNEDAGTIAGTEVTGVIPAGEGILFKGTAGATVAITETAEEAPVITGNDLKGSTDGNGDLVAKPTYCYVLKGDTFKKFTGTALTANKAFFAASSDLAPQSFEITFEGEATAVEAVAETNAEAVAPVKVIKNGKLYIGNYNVAGQQVK